MRIKSTMIFGILFFLLAASTEAQYGNDPSYSSSRDNIRYYFNAHIGYDYSTMRNGGSYSYFGGPAFGGAIEVKVKAKEVAFGMKGGITVSALKNNANDERIEESFTSTSIFMMPKIYVGRRLYLGVGLRLAPSSLKHVENRVTTTYKYLAYGITSTIGLDFPIGKAGYFVISPEIKYDFMRLQPLNAASPERKMNSLMFIVNFQLML